MLIFPYPWWKVPADFCSLFILLLNVFWESKFVHVSMLWLYLTSWLVVFIFLQLPPPTVLFEINGQNQAKAHVEKREEKLWLVRWGGKACLRRREPLTAAPVLRERRNSIQYWESFCANLSYQPADFLATGVSFFSWEQSGVWCLQPAAVTGLCPVSDLKIHHWPPPGGFSPCGPGAGADDAHSMSRYRTRSSPQVLRERFFFHEH